MRVLLALALAFGCKAKDSSPMTVDQLSASAGDEVTVTGFVVDGSITTKVVAQRGQQELTLEKNGKQLRVRHLGPPPDTLRDRAEATVHGKLVREGADLVLVSEGDKGLSAKNY